MNRRLLVTLTFGSLSFFLLMTSAVYHTRSAAQSRDSYCAYGSNGWLNRNIKVSVNTIYSETFKTQAPPVYKHGEPICADVWMTNLGDQPACVCVSAPIYQNQPRLTKNGAGVPYLPERADWIKRNWNNEDSGCWEITRPYVFVKLEPHAPRRVDWFVLNEGERKSGNIKWYDTLAPGHYQLLLLRKLDCCAGPDVQAEAFDFEITNEEFVLR